MRLKGYEQAAILATVKHFDSNARVYLFGFLADDTKKGGDIDLLLMSGTITGDTKRAIKTRLSVNRRSIRMIRNDIAREYLPEAIREILGKVLSLTPHLLEKVVMADSADVCCCCKTHDRHVSL